jgi:hypothetical protein
MTNDEPMKGSAARVQRALRGYGLHVMVREMPSSTRTKLLRQSGARWGRSRNP